MNWIENLYATYEQHKQIAGVDNGIDPVLLPISHTWQNAQVECTINEDLEMVSAIALEKKDAQTMIPSTIASANRTSKAVPHPLFDKLSYVAKDYENYHKGKHGNFDIYEEQLKAWCVLPSAPKCLQVLLNYLQKGTLIDDLVKLQMLYLDEEHQIIDKWNREDEKPAIFTNQASLPSDMFIRFCIQGGLGKHTRIWKEKAVQDSFIEFYLPTITERDVCYVSGEIEPITNIHSAYLRFPGDHAKLISANDSRGFTYRGKFQDSNQAMSLSYMSSQKVHNALKWLISKQGLNIDGFVILAWGSKELDVWKPLNVNFKEMEVTGIDEVPSTYESYANNLSKAISGYSNKRFKEANEHITVLAVDNATPGRLSIVYYNQLLHSDFLARIKNWYQTCAFPKQVYATKYEDEKGKSAYKYTWYTGAPSIDTIIKTAYGSYVKEKLKKNTTRRLLSCILDETPIPKDIVDSIFQRLIHPNSMDNNEYKLCLYAGCAIVRKYLNDVEKQRTGKEEAWKMQLDKENKDTVYLWGRLLGASHVIESLGNKASGESDTRDTNAVRYGTQFQVNPGLIWNNIHNSLPIYLKKIRKQMKNGGGEIADKLEQEVLMIMAQLEDRVDANEKPLDYRYLLSYASERLFLEKMVYAISHKQYNEKESNDENITE